jgi:hypothetical protein
VDRAVPSPSLRVIAVSGDSGDIEFDPLGAGVTTVLATIPGVVTTAAGSVTVTVGGG